MPEQNEETLGVSASEGVRVADQFGVAHQKMSGIGGTLHITDENGLSVVPRIAWDLSVKTKKPVIIVVRGV